MMEPIRTIKVDKGGAFVVPQSAWMGAREIDLDDRAIFLIHKDNLTPEEVAQILTAMKGGAP